MWLWLMYLVMFPTQTLAITVRTDLYLFFYFFVSCPNSARHHAFFLVDFLSDGEEGKRKRLILGVCSNVPE